MLSLSLSLRFQCTPASGEVVWGAGLIQDSALPRPSYRRGLLDAVEADP